MTNNLPFLSIIIPCRDEEKYIGKCLDSLISQDYPKNKMEILVVNGMSKDRTGEIVKRYIKQYLFIKLLENPQGFTPFGLNIGIKKAKGEIIVRIDAHASYQKDYISKCVRYLNEYRADNVGGVIKTLPKRSGPVAKAIAISLAHPFGAGTSYFRTGSKKPRQVDTVFGGCYRKEVFKKIGLFNEKLIRSQDIEFNKRLKKAGGKILLVPDITAFYYPSDNLKDFFWHNFTDGIWTIYPLKFGIKIFSWRHLIPLKFVSILIGFGVLSFVSRIFFLLFLAIIFLYLSVNLCFSLVIAKKEKDFRFLFLMPVVFISRHIGYGLGSILGFFKLFRK